MRSESIQQKELVGTVITIVQQELQGTSIVIEETTALQDLKGFDSMMVVGLLERLENQLDIEMDPALILPETFVSPTTIADALLKSQQCMQERVS